MYVRTTSQRFRVLRREAASREETFNPFLTGSPFQLARFPLYILEDEASFVQLNEDDLQMLMEQDPTVTVKELAENPGFII
ncbi:hypothetical protein Trydic_g3549 [Trypoxylus dichotomus]